MADYIYTRVSTDGQSTGPQVLELLSQHPLARVVSETAGGSRRRPKLDELVRALRRGDRLIVAGLDRLGRRTTEVLGMIEDLQRRGVVLVSKREGVDYSTPAGRLLTQVLVAVAEMEHSMIAERTRAGLEAARRRGAILGRDQTFSRESVAEAFRMMDEGSSLSAAARHVGMTPTHLSRLRKRGASALVEKPKHAQPSDRLVSLRLVSSRA
jgi:DNA invertase Pin-like site-specific DNA recombinase